MAFENGAVLWATAAAALGVIAVHLLSWRRPEPRALPTARFVPPAAQRALSRRIRPSDLLLLALRLVAVWAIGLAVAGPAYHIRQPGIARVIIADRSRAVARLAEVRDSVERLASEATVTRVVLFDSLPTVAGEMAWRDSSGRTRRGDLDAALITAIREAVDMRNRFDSVDMVLVSALLAEEVSAGTREIVAAYGSPLRFVPVQARPANVPPALGGGAWPPATDPVGAALRLTMRTTRPWLRVSRSELTAADSAHATAGGVVVHWLESPEAPLRNDGVLSASGAVVGAFARLDAPAGTPVAWWSDGSPAAAQEPLGTGCVRHVSIGIPARGDAVLRPAFLRLVHDLAAPCDGGDARALLASERSWLTPPDANAPPVAGAPGSAPLTRRLLLGLALLALVAEWWLRRRRERIPQFVTRRPSTGRAQRGHLETPGEVA